MLWILRRLLGDAAHDELGQRDAAASSSHVATSRLRGLAWSRSARRRAADERRRRSARPADRVARAHASASAGEPLPADARIVHLCLGKANPERQNGVNRVVHHLAVAQRRAGRRVEVWGLTPTPGAPTGARPYGLRLFRRGRARVVLDRALVSALRELAPPVLFHLHGALLPEMALAARHLRGARIPYVFTPHGAYSPHALAKRWLAKRLVIALFDRGMLRGARAVQAFTRRDADAIAAFVAPARVRVVPNGQDALTAPDASWPGAAPERPLFGFCGRLDAYTKGLDLLLDGFAAHVAPGRPGSLWLIGDGPDRGALERRAQALGVAERVTFFGARFGDEKLGLLARLDAFVHPSRHEGLPGAVLEAAALGLPLCVSEGTNLAEPVRALAAGLVVGDDGAAGVARALDELAGARERGALASFGAGAARMIEEQFAWARVEERVARDLYALAPRALARAASQGSAAEPAQEPAS